MGWGNAFYKSYLDQKCKKVLQPRKKHVQHELIELQIPFVQWVERYYPNVAKRLISIPNEATYKNKRLLQAGVKAGVNGTPGNILLDTQTGNAVSVAGAVPINMLEDSFTSLKEGQNDEIDIDPVSDGDYVLGNRLGRYVLFEYSDYDCPFCSSFHATAKQFVENNADVAWVYRQFPLDSLHPNARAKSEAALCAGQVGGNDAFWAFTDAMFGL